MAETGESQKAELQDALTERNEGLNDRTKGIAEEILDKSGETAAANFFAMHESINFLHETSQLRDRDPKKYAEYLRAMKEAVITLVNGLSLGRSDETIGRQTKIAEEGHWGGGKLVTGIKSAIKDVAGSVGPRESVMSTEDTLIIPR